MIATVSILGTGQCHSWQNRAPQKGTPSREEGGELYIKYTEFELMVAYWMDVFLLDELELVLEVRIKVRCSCQMIIEAMHMNEFSEIV